MATAFNPIVDTSGRFPAVTRATNLHFLQTNNEHSFVESQRERIYSIKYSSVLCHPVPNRPLGSVKHLDIF